MALSSGTFSRAGWRAASALPPPPPLLLLLLLLLLAVGMAARDVRAHGTGGRGAKIEEGREGAHPLPSSSPAAAAAAAAAARTGRKSDSPRTLKSFTPTQ